MLLSRRGWRDGALRFGNRFGIGRCGGRKPFTIMTILIPDPQDAPERSPLERTRRSADPKPFEGVERRRNPLPVAPPIGGVQIHEVTVFHELGKALTSSLQLDQVLRTIMEKINEVLRPDTWSLLLMDM